MANDKPLISDHAPKGRPAGNKVTICSVYPVAKSWEGKHENGIVAYVLPAAPPAPLYSLCRVYDTYTTIIDVSDLEQKPFYAKKDISAMALAEELVRIWAGDAPATGVDGLGKSSIGIKIIAGDVPTAEELADLRAQQKAYDDAAVHEADQLWLGNDQQKRRARAKRYRQSLERLNLNPDGHPWYTLLDVGPRKNCVACAKSISANALRCEHCQANLPQFCLELGIDPKDDPVVLKVITALKAKKT